VLPMSPVKSVTYVSERTTDLPIN